MHFRLHEWIMKWVRSVWLLKLKHNELQIRFLNDFLARKVVITRGTSLKFNFFPKNLLRSGSSWKLFLIESKNFSLPLPLALL